MRRIPAGVVREYRKEQLRSFREEVRSAIEAADRARKALAGRRILETSAEFYCGAGRSLAVAVDVRG